MGRCKVQIQLWLTAVVINIKRAVKQLVKTEAMAGSQEDTNNSLIAGMFGNAVKKIVRTMHQFLLTKALRQQSQQKKDELDH
jgi:ribosomal protein S2